MQRLLGEYRCDADAVRDDLRAFSGTRVEHHRHLRCENQFSMPC
jgi:hypothetical protein